MGFAIKSEDAMAAPDGAVPGRPLDWVLSAICAAMSAEIADMEERVARHDREEEAAFDLLDEARRRLRRAQGRFDRWRWVPVLGTRLQREVKSARDEVRRVKDGIAHGRAAISRLNKSVAQATISYEMLIMLGQREYCVPDPMPARTRKFLRRFEDAVKRDLLRSQVHELARDISEILGDWAAASLLFLQSRRSQPVEEGEERESSLVFDKAKGAFVEVRDGYIKPSASNHGLRRIYLPVPRDWEAKVVRAGGRVDDSTVNHVMSRVWVGFEDYERFEQYLPRSYRKSPPDLDFESLRLEASGHGFALHPRQRERAIRDMGERQGWRCSLCGSYGGLIWDRLRDIRSAEMSTPLALRPQWSYRRVEGGAGVAELVDLLLICRDCELAFDTDRLDGLLRGRDDFLRKQVHEHVHRRRMMLLRCEESALAAREKALEGHLASLADVSPWVLDLHRLPEISKVFAEGVIAREDALIAGIPILSEDGEELVPARHVDQIVHHSSSRASDSPRGSSKETIENSEQAVKQQDAWRFT